MSEQNKKNAGSPADKDAKNAAGFDQKQPTNAGGVDDIEEGEERIDDEDRSGQRDAGQAGEDRPSESPKTGYPNNRSGDRRKS